MRMPPEILTRLLKGEHFDVEQRKELELWPSDTLNYVEILQHLTSIIEKNEWFPFELSRDGSGEAIYEGIVIHRENTDRYRCYVQRTSAVYPNITAEKSEIIFKTAMEAAEYYMKWALNLPGRLDGWPVV